MKKKMLLLGFVISAMSYAETAEIKLDDTVVKSTTGFETSIRKVVANPTVVTAKEIEEKHYKTVLDVLRDMPAVNIMSNTFGSMVDLRGQGGTDGNSGGAKKNVQILVDGIAVNSLETSMTSTPINTIAVENIEKIEVIPGGGAVLYGSGTAGGVINIITKSGKGLRGNVGFDVNSFDGNKDSFSIGNTFGKFDVDLSYSNNKAGGYRDDSKNDSEYFQGKVKYNISDKQNIEFKYANYGEERNLLDNLTKEKLDADRNQGDSLIDTMETDKDDYVITYNNKLSDSLDLNVVAFHQQTAMKMNQHMMPAIPPSKWRFEDKKKGIKPKLKYSYGDDSSVIFGLDYIDNTGGRYGIINTPQMPPIPPILYNTKYRNISLGKETLAGFVMNNYKYNNFEFNQGIRYEKSDYDIKRGNLNKSKDESNIAYELSGNYLYSDTGKTYLRYERGFTAPQPALLTNKYGGNYYLNDLDSETYNSLELGVTDFIGKTSVNMSVYYSSMKDELYTYMSEGMMNSNILNYNIDETERYGMEIRLEQYFDKLTLSQGYQYTHAEIKEGREKKISAGGDITPGEDISGNKIAGVPEHKLTLGARYDVTEKLNLNGEVVYNGNSYIDNANKYNKLNSYIVANIRANYKYNEDVTIYAGINNLFDEKYNNSMSYSGGEYTYDPAAERNYYAGFSYTL